MKKYIIFVEKNLSEKALGQIDMIKSCLKEDQLTRIYTQKYDRDLESTAKCLKENIDFVVVLGSDKTFRLVVNGIISSRKKRIIETPILYVPVNSYNDMINNTGFYEPIEEYILEARENITEHDVFQFNHKPFYNIAAGGYLMDTPYNIREFEKELLMDKRNYLKEIIKRTNEIPPKHYMKLNIDEKVIEGEYIASVFANTHSICNTVFLPEASLKDNRCEIILLKDTSCLNMIIELTHVLEGKKRLDELSFAEYYSGQNIHLELEQIYENPFCLDGERNVTNTKKINVEPLTKIRVMKAISHNSFSG